MSVSVHQSVQTHLHIYIYCTVMSIKLRAVWAFQALSVLSFSWFNALAQQQYPTAVRMKGVRRRNNQINCKHLQTGEIWMHGFLAIILLDGLACVTGLSEDEVLVKIIPVPQHSGQFTVVKQVCVVSG